MGFILHKTSSHLHILTGFILYTKHINGVHVVNKWCLYCKRISMWNMTGFNLFLRLLFSYYHDFLDIKSLVTSVEMTIKILLHWRNQTCWWYGPENKLCQSLFFWAMSIDTWLVLNEFNLNCLSHGPVKSWPNVVLLFWLAPMYWSTFLPWLIRCFKLWPS